jgi:FCP1-like phosphatase family protein
MKCPHTVRLNNLCANCGEELFTTDKLYNPLHTTDIIQTTVVRRSTRPVLVIDLDHTILFTSLARSHPVDFCFVNDRVSYFVTLRPFLAEFLETVHAHFDLHVYTMGSRKYAQEILKVIDKDGKYFQDRIITRDENNNKLVKELSRLGMSSKDVVVLDDRVDVWGYEENVVLIKPFYLKRERDFNDPSEIAAREEKFADSDVCEKNEIDIPIAGKEDKELLFAGKYLEKIFRKYKKTRNVKKILKCEKKKLFKNFRFYFNLEDPLIPIVRFYHGNFFGKCKLEISNDVFVLKKAKKLYVVKKQWIYECIYKRRTMSLKGYVEEEAEDSEPDDVNDIERQYLFPML